MSKIVGRHFKSKPTADEALERIAKVRGEESKTQLINDFIVGYDRELQERLAAADLEKYLAGELTPDKYRMAMARFAVARRKLGPAASVEAVTELAGTIKITIKPKAAVAQVAE
jgi:hypothetical protein